MKIRLLWLLRLSNLEAWFRIQCTFFILLVHLNVISHLVGLTATGLYVSCWIGSGCCLVRDIIVGVNVLRWIDSGCLVGVTSVGLYGTCWIGIGCCLVGIIAMGLNVICWFSSGSCLVGLIAMCLCVLCWISND